MLSTLESAGVRPASRMLYRAFSAIAHRRLRLHFRALRIAHADRLAGITGPLIVYMNHSSWWDPLVGISVANVLLPGRVGYAPIDAAALKQYGFFSRIGMFPVDQSSVRGAVQFLRASQAVLASGGMLWLTPQGHFVDMRERPVRLRAGLGALMHRLQGAVAVPLAAEYSFWNQPLPEALVQVGEPIVIGPTQRSSAEWTQQLETNLQTAQDELAVLSRARDEQAFRVLLQGGRGTSGVYGAWQRVRARLHGEAFRPDHEASRSSRDAD